MDIHLVSQLEASEEKEGGETAMERVLRGHLQHANALEKKTRETRYRLEIADWQSCLKLPKQVKRMPKHSLGKYSFDGQRSTWNEQTSLLR